MTPQQVVIDTNVWVAGVLYKGAPYNCLKLVEAGDLNAFADGKIIEEIFDVIERPKFSRRKKTLGLSNQILHLKILSLISVSEDCNSVELSENERSRDEDDNKFIQCALLNNCRFIISGDSDLLVMKEVRGVKIVSPKEYLNARK